MRDETNAEAAYHAAAMSGAAINGVDMVDADEIRWTLGPLPAIDPLLVSDEDLFVEALRDGEAYRLLAQQAIHRLHALERVFDHLQRQHYRLLDQHRALRGQAASCR